MAWPWRSLFSSTPGSLPKGTYVSPPPPQTLPPPYSSQVAIRGNSRQKETFFICDYCFLSSPYLITYLGISSYNILQYTTVVPSISFQRCTTQQPSKITIPIFTSQYVIGLFAEYRSYYVHHPSSITPPLSTNYTLSLPIYVSSGFCSSWCPPPNSFILRYIQFS
jgi:hypothetical protein